MNTELKIASNNIINIETKKKFKDIEDQEQKIIINYTVWEQLLDFVDKIGKDTKIESGLLILRTNNGDIRTEVSNMSEEEFISTLDEAKQRFYFNKFMESFI